MPAIIPGRAKSIIRSSSAPVLSGRLLRVTVLDAKENLQRYLRNARETVLWKLDGLGEYDVRRPLTPTGTNLLVDPD